MNSKLNLQNFVNILTLKLTKKEKKKEKEKKKHVKEKMYLMKRKWQITTRKSSICHKFKAIATKGSYSGNRNFL